MNNFEMVLFLFWKIRFTKRKSSDIIFVTIGDSGARKASLSSTAKEIISNAVSDDTMIIPYKTVFLTVYILMIILWKDYILSR